MDSVIESESHVISDNLIELNDDVLLETMKHLHTFDVIALRQVCQRLQWLADDYLARKVKMFCIDAMLEHRFAEIIRNVGPHLETLHITSTGTPNRPHKLRQQLLGMNKYCKKLKQLTVEARRAHHTLPLSLTSLSKLYVEQLCYMDLRNIKIEKDFELATAFPNLEVLKLEAISNFSGQSLIGLHHLHTLHVSLCAQLKPNYLYDFFKAKGDALKELLVHKCVEIDEIILNQINLYLPNIELISLIFSCPASFDPGALHALQALRELSLHNFRVYDVNRFVERIAVNNRLERWEINSENAKIYQLDRAAISQLERCNRLQNLAFVKCNFVTDDLLLRLAKTLQLKQFHLNDCWGFSAAGLRKFVQISKHLIYLSIHNCVILKSATVDIANAVLEDEERLPIQIDYDIDCGYQYSSDYDDSDGNYYDGYCDSDESDIESM